MFAIVKEFNSVSDLSEFQHALLRKKEGAQDVKVIENNNLVRVFCVSQEPFPEDFLARVLARNPKWRVIENYEQ